MSSGRSVILLVLLTSSLLFACAEPTRECEPQDMVMASNGCGTCGCLATGQWNCLDDCIPQVPDEEPRCVPGCVHDRDLDEPGLQHDCFASSFDPEVHPPRCEIDSGALELPEGQQCCFELAGDASGSTPATWDDIDEACVTDRTNAEFLTVGECFVPHMVQCTWEGDEPPFECFAQ